MAAVGSFAERVARPLRAALDFALGELVAQFGVLACERVDRAGQAVAFFADRGGVAELAGERRALCERVFELVLGAGERRGEPGAIDEVRILVAAEAALARARESVELAAQQRRGARSARVSARRARRACRVSTVGSAASCARSRSSWSRSSPSVPLTGATISGSARSACCSCSGSTAGWVELRVVESSGGGELVDREVFVVTDEHLPPDARQHLAVLRRRQARCRARIPRARRAGFAVAYEESGVAAGA